MSDPWQKSLDEQLADLARDVAPARDLWPGIAARLGRSPRRARSMWLAAAAGVAGACVASALTWAVLNGRTSAPLSAPVSVPSSVPAVAMRAPSFEELRNPRYVTARNSLEVDFRERLALLDPVTRGKIEASLAIIRQAHEDIRKALASDPESPVLEQLWQSTWHDEFDLYDHVVRSTEPTMTRT
jgi:hypothetical protein